MLLLKRLDKSVIIWGTTTGTTFSRVVLYYLSHPLWSRSPNLLILNGSSSDLERIGWDQSRLPWEMGLRIEDVEVDDVTPSLDSARFELLSAENRQQNWKRRGQETGEEEEEEEERRVATLGLACIVSPDPDAIASRGTTRESGREQRGQQRTVKCMTYYLEGNN